MLEWLAADGVACGGIHVDVDAKDAGHEPFVEFLRGVILVISPSFVTAGEIEITIGSEHHATGIMKFLLVELLDQDRFGIGVDGELSVGDVEARKSPERIVSVRAAIRIGPPLIGDVDKTAVGGGGLAELRMEGDAGHAAVGHGENL